LIDIQFQKANIVYRCTSDLGLREIASRIGKAVRHRGNLGLRSRENPVDSKTWRHWGRC
jgi:hypothetical protein